MTKISKEEILALLQSTENYRVERTISTANMDKFCEAICAFSNDLPDSRRKGYLLIGAYDNGQLSGLKVDDALLKKISAIRSDGNILPLPVMTVERLEFPEGDLLVAEVSPSLLPPVRYRGRVFVRIGPRRDIASEAEERILTERRMAYMATFDATPCLGATLDDLNLDYIKKQYLPAVVAPDILAEDSRDIKEQLSSIRLYDRTHDCPTYAAIILFGKNPRYYLPGAYIQYVRFAGNVIGGEVLNEKRFHGPLFQMLPALESFVSDAIVTQRPVSVSLFREKTVINYPNNALRELLMNACMHRDYQSNMPIRLYQFDDHIEIMNAGGLYGEARPENFPTVNDYRNPVVAEAMKEMKYVNMFNQGVRRVQDMLRENGNKKAEFDVSKLTAFMVTVLSNLDDTEDVPQDVPQDGTQERLNVDNQSNKESQSGTQDDTEDVPQGVPQGGTQESFSVDIQGNKEFRNVAQGDVQNDTQGGFKDDTEGGIQDDTQGSHMLDIKEYNGGKNDTQGILKGKTLDFWIEKQIKINPKITTEELAVLSERSIITIKRHISNLAHIKYVGSGYSGHWEVRDKR